MDTQHGFVDIAAIPLGMVERIEVITAGASALYGSDAVGGVINVVLRRVPGCSGRLRARGRFAQAMRRDFAHRASPKPKSPAVPTLIPSMIRGARPPPLRMSPSAAGAQPDARPEISRHVTAGVVWSPPFFSGVSFEANYARTRQRDLLQSLGADTLLHNENLFAGRITRAAPTAQDIARNQPGALTTIDASFVNFGAASNESLDLAAAWEHVSPQWGRWRATLMATRTLRMRVALQPGGAPLDPLGRTYSISSVVPF